MFHTPHVTFVSTCYTRVQQVFFLCLKLDLSGNNLCLLPPALKAHRSLRKLYVEKNQLEELPDWIGDLPEIVELSLLDNKLKGSPLPETLAIVSSHLKVQRFLNFNFCYTVYM